MTNDKMVVDKMFAETKCHTKNSNKFAHIQRLHFDEFLIFQFTFDLIIRILID